eukprot:TRINITY_DN4893_c0_g1_i3.p2 TRINITY_DN4893_c0_g1~~TRINITY_DN4893_c0_g1_i3.p2  ORF type:complete len:127 (+),score=18.00 TRINITY_DN4893_c0_g1_i3:350-730(+)
MGCPAGPSVELATEDRAKAFAECNADNLHQRSPMECNALGMEDRANDLLERDKKCVSRRDVAFRTLWKSPTHVVLFNAQEEKLASFLEEQCYSKVAQFFHAHFAVDRELQAHVAVYAKEDEDRCHS